MILEERETLEDGKEDEFLENEDHTSADLESDTECEEEDRIDHLHTLDTLDSPRGWWCPICPTQRTTVKLCLYTYLFENQFEWGHGSGDILEREEI